MPVSLYWLTGLLGIALLLVLFMVVGSVDFPTGTLLRYHQASRCDGSPHAYPLTSAGIAAILDAPVLNQKDCWHWVTLPENNPAQDIKVDTRNPQLRRVSYRVNYTVPKNWDSAKPLMVYVPRVIAHAWQVSINGKVVADNRFEWRSTWNIPIAVSFYVDSSQLNQSLAIDVDVVATVAEGFSIARISVGDVATIRNQKNLREYLQVTMPQATSLAMLLLGFFFFSFWLARREESVYLIMAMVSLAFCIMNLKYSLRRPDDPNLDAWYVAIIYNSTVPWLGWLVFLYGECFAKRSIRWLGWLLWLVAATVTWFSLPFNLGQSDYNLLIMIIYILAGAMAVSAVVFFAIVSSNIDLYVMASMVVIGLITGVHDMLLVANRVNPENLHMIPYGGLSVFLGFLYAIQRRYVAAIVNQEHLNFELRTQQQRLLELEHEQTLANERQRLIHDMHDGLGSSLLSTLAAVEHNHMPYEAVADALRSCVDDLRLVIDSMEPATNNLVTLLATIRYRLGQRLDNAGLKLIWEINDLPSLEWLEPTDALNILRLVQEALINVLKHANASNIHVTTRYVEQQVEIQITDNGKGYNPNTITLGRGLYSQRSRAERLGGQLHINSVVGGGTTLRLLLPVRKPLY